MTKVSDILAQRLDLTLDETDYEPTPVVHPALTTEEVIDRLRAVGAFIASADADPPTRLKHCWAIDCAIAKLRTL